MNRYDLYADIFMIGIKEKNSTMKKSFKERVKLKNRIRNVTMAKSEKIIGSFDGNSNMALDQTN